MPEYQTPTLDKILGGLSTGVGLGTTAAGLLGASASGLMGAGMAAFLTNPFTAPLAALLPFAAKMFGPGSDGPKMVGATNLVEPYDKLLTQRRDDFLKNSASATPEQKLQFAAEQEAIIQDMFNNLNKYSGELGDIGARSIAERQQGGKHDFYKYYVAPITGGARAADFAKANSLTMPNVSGTGGIGGAAAPGGLNLSGVPRFGGSGSTAANSGVPAGTLNLGGGGNALSTVAPLVAGGAGTAMDLSNVGGWLQDLFGNKTFQSVLTNSIPAVTGILGGLGQKSSNDTANQTLQAAIGDLLGRGDQFANLSADQQAQLISSLNVLLSNGGVTPSFQALQSDIANTGSNIPALFGQNLADPQAIQMLLQSIGDPRLQGSMSSAANMVKQGGMTPELAQLFQTAGAFQTGSSGQQMQLQDLANQLSANGGMTPFLNTLQGAGTDALASKGMTPEIQQALAPFMNILKSGGKNAENTSLFNRGMDLFGREALLPMSTAINIAGDQAGSAVQQQFEQARREAQARGGGPGAIVGGGSANAARADYADQAARAIASAKQNAMMSQQGLQLQQQATGAGAAGQGASLMAQMLGLGQSGVGNLLSTAAGRETGLGGLGATAQQLGNQRTGMGGDFLNTIMQVALGGGNLASSGLGQQTSRYNAGQNAVQGLGTLQQGGFDKILQGLLQGSQQGVQQGQAMGTLLNSNQEILSRNEIGAMSNINDLLRILAGVSGNNLNAAGNLYQASSGLQTPLATGQRNSPISDAITAAAPGIGQWIQSAIKGLGSSNGGGYVPIPNSTVAPYVTGVSNPVPFNATKFS